MLGKYSLILLLMLLATSFNLTAQNQAEMNQNAKNDFNKVNAKLNILCKQVMKLLAGKEKQLMILAQKIGLSSEIHTVNSKLKNTME
jgi:hypothetical protein